MRLPKFTIPDVVPRSGSVDTKLGAPIVFDNANLRSDEACLQVASVQKSL